MAATSPGSATSKTQGLARGVRASCNPVNQTDTNKKRTYVRLFLYKPQTSFISKLITRLGVESEGFEGTDLAVLGHLEDPRPCKGRPN